MGFIASTFVYFAVPHKLMPRLRFALVALFFSFGWTHRRMNMISVSSLFFLCVWLFFFFFNFISFHEFSDCARHSCCSRNQTVSRYRQQINALTANQSFPDNFNILASHIFYFVKLYSKYMRSLLRFFSLCSSAVVSALDKKCLFAVTSTQLHRTQIITQKCNAQIRYKKTHHEVDTISNNVIDGIK